MSTKILQVKEINLATRLNELLKEKNIQKKELYGDFGGKNTITRWCNEESPINPSSIRNTDKLEKLANFLDVDLDYLLCKQVEKKKKEDLLNIKVSENLIREIELLDNGNILRSYLSNLGYKIEDIPVQGKEIEYQTIESKFDNNRVRFYLLTLVDNEPTEYAIRITYESKTIELTEKEYFDFLKRAEIYLKGEMNLLFDEK